MEQQCDDLRLQRDLFERTFHAASTTLKHECERAEEFHSFNIRLEARVHELQAELSATGAQHIKYERLCNEQLGEKDIALDRANEKLEKASLESEEKQRKLLVNLEKENARAEFFFKQHEKAKDIIRRLERDKIECADASQFHHLVEITELRDQLDNQKVHIERLEEKKLEAYNNAQKLHSELTCMQKELSEKATSMKTICEKPIKSIENRSKKKI